jgi:HicA-like toxin of HicAB toxin-antitoxin system
VAAIGPESGRKGWVMNQKHQKTFAALFADPVRANLAWNDIEAMFGGLGAEVSEGEGSRVHVVLNGVRSTFHRPHPQREIGKGMVRSIRAFLDQAGIDLDEE